MRYNIRIPQKKLVDMSSKLSLEEIILLEYILSLCNSTSQAVKDKRIVQDGVTYTWICYKSFLSETPILRGKTKGTITPRVKNLVKEEFVISFQEYRTHRKYVSLLPKAYELFKKTNTPVNKSKQHNSENSTGAFNKPNIDNNNKDKDIKDNMFPEKLKTIIDSPITENQKVDYLLEVFKEAFGLDTLDGTEKKNIDDCYLCIKKFENINNVEMIIKTASIDDFWCDKITSFRDILNHGIKIVQSHRGKQLKNKVAII
jgi:DNA-binding MarR family transcriptional regulator